MSSNHPRSKPGGIGPREFTRACGQFATGVAIATATDGAGVPHGITVNSFTSVSLSPPLVLICISHPAPILPIFREVGRFGLNMLNESQRRLSERFSRRSRHPFDGVSWYPGETGVPLIADVLATLECRLVRAEPAGDHDILIAEVVATSVRGGRPLVFYGSTYRRLEP